MWFGGLFGRKEGAYNPFDQEHFKIYLGKTFLRPGKGVYAITPEGILIRGTYIREEETFRGSPLFDEWGPIQHSNNNVEGLGGIAPEHAEFFMHLNKMRNNYKTRDRAIRKARKALRDYGKNPGIGKHLFIMVPSSFLFTTTPVEEICVVRTFD